MLKQQEDSYNEYKNKAIKAMGGFYGTGYGVVKNLEYDGDQQEEEKEES